MVLPSRRRALTIIGALLLSSGCGRRGEEEAAGAAVVPVGFGVVVRDTITDRLDLIGRLQPIPGGAVVMASPADAIVERVLVAPGQSVAAGEQLLALDAPDLRAQALSLVAQAEAATRDLERQEQLLAEGITARRQVEERRAQAAAARASATAAESLLARTSVKSPRAGLVQRIAVGPGERVGAGQVLIEVVEPHPLDLATQVPLLDLARVKVGQRATVEIEGASGRWEGRVVAVAPSVDTASNNGQVLIRVTATDPVLRPGSGGRAHLVVGLRRDVLIVPDSSLTMVGNQLSVFVIGKDSVARARAVVAGARLGGRAEVKGDLSPGDRVVTTGSYGLPDSTRVTTRPER
jgi:RND family efflux transporter MFP subunit